MRKLCCTMIVLFFVSVSNVWADEAEKDFVSLFDGKTLTGWVKRGGDATYHVDGDCIVGVVADQERNTFLCSEKIYENFVFKAQFKFDKPFNSGIQFRSNASPDGARERVFGYQYEMDTDRMTAAVYDEARRDRWVDPLTEEVQQKSKDAFKVGDWNDVTIQCVGPSIKTYLNGVKISDIMDTADTKGFFGLQVHAANSPGQVRWKNIRVKELPKSSWQSFFDPKKPLDTYLEVKPAGKWTMDENGVVYAVSESAERRDGLVLSKENYPNVVAKITFKQEQGNSGLYFRATPIDKPHWVKGIQNEIDALATGGIWEVEGRGWLAPPDKEKIQKVFKPNEWNELSLVAIDGHIVTILNGTEISNINDDQVVRDGKLGLQLHGSNNMGYWFKDFEAMQVTPEMVKLIQE